jgi:hypothetical protein
MFEEPQYPMETCGNMILMIEKNDAFPSCGGCREESNNTNQSVPRTITRTIIVDPAKNRLDRPRQMTKMPRRITGKVVLMQSSLSLWMHWWSSSSS